MISPLIPPHGMTAIETITTMIISIGAIVNSARSTPAGRNSSLNRNFIPSAMGWSNPRGPTRLGPMRSCTHDATLRSSRIRYATVPSTTTCMAMAIQNQGGMLLIRSVMIGSLRPPERFQHLVEQLVQRVKPCRLGHGDDAVQAVVVNGDDEARLGVATALYLVTLDDVDLRGVAAERGVTRLDDPWVGHRALEVLDVRGRGRRQVRSRLEVRRRDDEHLGLR